MFCTQNVDSAWIVHRRLVNLLHDLPDDRRPIDLIEAEDIAAFLSGVNVGYAGHLKMIGRKARAIRSPLFSDDGLDFLERVFVPDTNDQDAVLRWDPVAGPYRPSEDKVLKAEIDAAFNDGRIALYDYALIRCFRGFGPRPAQVAAMKVGDIRREADRDLIRIPMIKQRSVPPRGAFMPWKPVSQGLADLLALHITHNVEPRLAPGRDLRLAPLFPPIRSSLLAAESIEGHYTSIDLKQRYRRSIDPLGVRSPITGEVMAVNPRRERHTYLTYLAMHGCTSHEIAANAGHAKPTSREAYVDASIDHFQRMESIVGDLFVAIADRFLGTVTDSASDENAARNPDVILQTEELDDVGSCRVGGCGAVDAGVAPIACYTCRSFRAWADAPHGTLLEFLVEEQERLLADGHAAVADTRIATIVAIADVIEAIRARAVGDG